MGDNMEAYGLKYSFLYRAKMRGRYLYEVVIEEKGYGGDVEILKPCGDVLTIKQGVQDDSPFVSIKGSEATIEILCTDDMRYLSLFTVDARKFRVSIYEYRPDASGGESPTLIWRGFLDASSYTEKFARPPYKVTLKAMDGLTALSGYPFLDESEHRFEGMKSARELLDMCIDRLGLELPVCEWIGVRKSSGYRDTLSYVYYDCADIYRRNDQATWADVLSMCLPFGAQIFQSYGALHVRRVTSLIYKYRPDEYAQSHADLGLRRKAIIPLWQNGCGVSSSADLKILPPVRDVQLEVDGSTAQNLADSMCVYDRKQWKIPYGEGRFFEDAIQLRMVSNDASATYNATKCTFSRLVESTNSGGVTVKLDVLNLNSKERKVAVALFLQWFDRSAAMYRTEAWYPTERAWRPVDELSSDMSMYAERTIMASDRDHDTIAHRADPASYSSDSFEITTAGIPHEGQLWLGVKAGTIIDIDSGTYDWANLQIHNVEISISGNFDTIIPTKATCTINREYKDTMKVNLPIRDGEYCPNVALYLDNVMRDASNKLWLYAVAPYGGTNVFEMALSDVRNLRSDVAYEITGEVQCASPVDLNTLFVDRKYTGRLYYVNYLERLVARDLYKVQLYQLMDAHKHPQWSGEYRNLIDRNDYDVHSLFVVGNTLFFAEEYHLWRLEADGVPQRVCSYENPVHVHQGAGCIVVEGKDQTPWIAAYDESGQVLAKIDNVEEQLGIRSGDPVTRDAMTGIWKFAHIEGSRIEVTLFKDNACEIDFLSFDCANARKVLFAPNSVVVVTDKASFIHNFSIHAHNELAPVTYWPDSACVDAISRNAIVYRSEDGTHIISRVGMDLWLPGGVRVPASDVIALSDRYAVAYDGGEVIRVYDFYEGELVEIPTPGERAVAQVAVAGSMMYVLADGELLQYYLRDDTVLGNEESYTYVLDPHVSSEFIEAAGGSSTITAVFKVMDENGHIVSSEQVVPQVEGSADGFSISGNVVTAEGRGSKIGAERGIVLSLSHKYVHNGRVVVVTSQVIVKQQENIVERMVANVEIVSGNLPIKASGGTVRIAFPLSGVFTSGATSTLGIYPDTVTGSPLHTWLQAHTTPIDGRGVGMELSAPNLGTTATPERATTINMRMWCRNYMNEGYSIDHALQVTQLENRLEGYGVPTIEPSTVVVSDLPASGGTVSSSSLRFSGAQSMEYSSGDSEVVAFTQSTSGVSVKVTSAPTATSLGTTEKSRTKVGNVSFTVNLNGKTSTAVTADVYQAANRIESYNSPVISSFTVSDIPASGGSASKGNVMWNQTAVYTSGASGQASVADPEIKYSSAVTASSLGTTVKARTKVGTLTVTVTSHGKSSSKSCSVYQAANAMGYGKPVVESSSISIADIPASGGSVEVSDIRFAGAQAINYTSGSSNVLAFTQSTAGVEIRIAQGLTRQSLGKTIKARTRVGTVRFDLVLNGQTSNSLSADVYQAANNAESLEYVSYPGSSAIISGLSLQNYPRQGGQTEFYMKPTATFTSGDKDVVNPTASNVRSGATWATAVALDHATHGRIVRCTYAANNTGVSRQSMLTIQLYYGQLSTSTTVKISQL